MAYFSIFVLLSLWLGAVINFQSMATFITQIEY